MRRAGSEEKRFSIPILASRPVAGCALIVLWACMPVALDAFSVLPPLARRTRLVENGRGLRAEMQREGSALFDAGDCFYRAHSKVIRDLGVLALRVHRSAGDRALSPERLFLLGHNAIDGSIAHSAKPWHRLCLP